MPPRRLGPTGKPVSLFPHPEEARLRNARPDLQRAGAPAFDPETLRGLEKISQSAPSGVNAARFADIPQLSTRRETPGPSQLSLQDLTRLLQSRLGKLEHSLESARKAKNPTPEQKAKILLAKNLGRVVARLQSGETGYGRQQAMTGLLAAQVRYGEINAADFTDMNWAEASFAERIESALQVAGAAQANTKEALRLLRESGREVKELQNILQNDEAVLARLMGQLEELRGLGNGDLAAEQSGAALHDTLLDLKSEVSVYLIDVLALRSEEPVQVDETAARSVARAVAQNATLIAALAECRKIAERDVTEGTSVFVGKPRKKVSSLAAVLDSIDAAARMVESGAAVPADHFDAALRATNAEFAYKLGEKLEEVAAALK